MTATRPTQKKAATHQRKAGELSAEELDDVTGGTNAELAAAETTTKMEMNSWLEAAQAGSMDQAPPRKPKLSK